MLFCCCILWPYVNYVMFACCGPPRCLLCDQCGLNTHYVQVWKCELCCTHLLIFQMFYWTRLRPRIWQNAYCTKRAIPANCLQRRSFHVVLRACVAHGWIPFESFLDGDVVLRDYEAEQKGALFCTEEMGVFGWRDWENKGGVARLDRREDHREVHSVVELWSCSQPAPEVLFRRTEDRGKSIFL